MPQTDVAIKGLSHLRQRQGAAFFRTNSDDRLPTGRRGGEYKPSRGGSP